MKATIVALALCALGGAAFAQEAPRSSGFIRADANGDGVITRAEYDATIAAAFARVDANGDGVLAPPERRRGLAPPNAGGPPDPPDANGDGRVTRAEFDAYHSAEFTRMDQNHDGVLTPDEVPEGAGRRN